MGYWMELKGWVCKDPAKLIRYLVLFICCIIVMIQLTECFVKLKQPPISTHSYYVLNETLEMPAITICREPAYKEEVLSNISGGYCSHPKYDTCWFRYPFDLVDLEEFFMNSTFNLNETFLAFQYGLNGLNDNVEVTSSLHFYNGRCFTMRPRTLLHRATKNSGYSMILTHNIRNNHQYLYYENEPGWHLFIHDSKENFTEINMKASGRVEYVFVRIKEEIEIKLETQCFVKVNDNHNLCSTLNDYSDLKCGEICLWKDLAEKANCSGPWMYDIPHQPCSSCLSMTRLIREYGSLHFYNGRCFTMRPRTLLHRATKNSGYSMILTHNIRNNHQYLYYENEPGWHLFIHDSKENFTEINMKASGRVEYVFVRIKEEIEIKLETQCFVKVNDNHNLCSTLNDYSDLKCGEICLWKDLAEKANCSGPWMYDIPHQPCSSCLSMTRLIREYGRAYDSEENNACHCVQPCQTRLFSAYIQSRRNFRQPDPNTQVWIYYTTKLISMMEESPNYDSTQFIADVGGSLGFLLGLSVLGLIGILEHLTSLICCGNRSAKGVETIKENHFNSDLEMDKASQKSDETIDIAIIYP
uniref:Uncharacterized protein n=1 Tax=Glossina brevipalpis TaxID=37001 RepID=A0A1A9X0Q2_9MUSC